VRDAALLLQVASGYDARDPGAVSQAVPDFVAACDKPAKGLRIAWSPTLGYATSSPEVLKITEDAAKVFEEIGCRVTPVEKVFDADPLPMFMAEFFAGVGSKLKPVMEQSRDRLDPAVALMVDKALAQEAEAYFETVFQRYKLREMIAEFFVDYDLLLTPTLPVPAFETGLNVPPGYSDENAFTWIFYTYPFNLTGLPAASIPAGFTDDGLPVGLQIVDRHLMETDILSAASAFEEARPRADKKPPLT
jgi:aspartyl-tRNA(Asn)/glutamyl-tRNA(Gln) amidotransferase subunit A